METFYNSIKYIKFNNTLELDLDLSNNSFYRNTKNVKNLTCII